MTGSSRSSEYRREGGWEAGVKDLELTGTCLWMLVANSKKNQLDLCQNVRVMSILVFFSGERVNGGRGGGKRQAGVKDFELTGPCQWTLVTNSKKNRLDSCQNGQVMTILHSWWIPPPPLPVSSAPF